MPYMDEPKPDAAKMKLPGPPFKVRPGQVLDLEGVAIQSARLILRPVSLDYAGDIFAEFTPDITRYLMTQASGKLEDTVAFIEKAVAGRRAGRDLAVVILSRAHGEFLGAGGIHSLARVQEPSLGIWLKKSAHGHGYGREAVGALCAWAGEHLDYRALNYDVDRANTPSRMIAESLGGTIVAEQRLPRTTGGFLDSLLYRIPIAPRVGTK